MEANNFLKIYAKYCIIVIFLTTILLGITFSMNEYRLYIDKTNIYNNYYENKHKELNILKDYIVRNNFEGYIYKKPFYNGYETIQYSGTLGKCYLENSCKRLKEIISNINYYRVSYFNYIDKNNIFGQKGSFLSIKTDKDLYGNGSNELYYSKGFFKGKNEFDKINGNRMYRIIKIFNDDWGVINFDVD